MATPKLDKIIIEFRNRVSDPVIYMTGSLPDGLVISASEATTYVNRAMNKYFTDTWAAVQSDKWEFVNQLPELIAEATASWQLGGYANLPNGTRYTVAAPYLDYYEALDAVSSGTQGIIINDYVRFLDKDYLRVVALGLNSHYSASADNVIGIINGRTIYIYPDNSGSGYPNVYFRYVKQPIDPLTGNPLVQSGTTDSPFYDVRTELIAEIAEGIYRVDAQLPQQ